MGEDRTYWVYILTNGRCGSFYVGVTNSLVRRIAEHKAREVPGFTKTYGLDRLVYFQGFGDVHAAIHFEEQLKRWRRPWKMRLIEENNPYWADLHLEMMAVPPLHPDLREALAEYAPMAVIPVSPKAKTGTPQRRRSREKLGGAGRGQRCDVGAQGSRSSPLAKPG